MSLETQERTKRNGAKPDKARMVADDIVTPNGLATHLGMSRQNVALLTANAIIEQRSDGGYDQTACRLRYIKHLREVRARSPRSEADAAHAAAKTEMLQLRLQQQRGELMKGVDHEARVEAIIGLMLTHFSGWPARIGGHDLALRRRAEAVLREMRAEIAEAAIKLADEAGEPPREDA